MTLPTYFIRRLVLLWACSLITWATYKMYTSEYFIEVGVYGLTIGILATVIAFYHRTRSNDLKEKLDDSASEKHENDS